MNAMESGGKSAVEKRNVFGTSVFPTAPKARLFSENYESKRRIFYRTWQIN